MKRWACMLCHQDAPHRKRDICNDCQEWLVVRGLSWCAREKHRVLASDMTERDRWCKACRREANAERQYTPRLNQTWHARNKDRAKAYRARPDVRARYRAWKRAWYARNRDEVRAQMRARYTPGSQSERARAWRAAHPGYWRQWRINRKLRVLRSWRRAA